MSDNKIDSALVRATVSEVKPMNEADGADGMHLVTITHQVLVRNGDKSKDVDFLMGDTVQPGDTISGFLRFKPQKADPNKTVIYFGGLRKWEPKPAG